jgi:S1-C subfamily serine protease
VNGSVVLDLVLLALLGLYAWSGWRQGFVSAVLGLVGLLGGAFLAMRVAPSVLEDDLGLYRGTPVGVVALVVVVLAAAALGQMLFLLLARRIRDSVEAPSARALDSGLGLVAVLTASVLVLWVVADAVRVGGPPAARELVSRSAVVTVVDELVPPSASRLVDEATAALDRGGFPRVFEGLGPEPITPVEAPDANLVRDPQVAAALDSVIHVRAESRGCGTAQVGSGWVLSPRHVVTNAHVVTGSDRVRVSVRGTGREREARVVAFDPDRDVAVLDVPGLEARRLTQGQPLDTGDPAVLAGFPGDEGLWVGGARVRGTLTAQGADIYGDRPVVREIYSLRSQVRRGASGGPVLDPQGRVVGMVFATSLDDPDTGYALTLDEIAPVLRRGAAATGAVSTGACASA